MIEFNSKNARIWSRLGPSGALGIAAVELAEKNDNVLMITADLCFFSGLERFKKLYPDKLVNFGIAEQNMIGAAGGMAKEGFIPFASTYASFATSRCLDQVRVNMAYMNLPIKLIGLTAGFGAGILGATHMSVEDIAVIRALPNITILSPADCMEVIKCIMAAAEYNSPVYIRLTGPINTPIVYSEDYEFEIGKANILRKGKEVCFISTGSMVYQSIKAAEMLDELGVSSTVINMHTIKPIDISAINYAMEHEIIIVVEEHSVYGGLGGAVSEYIVQQDSKKRVELIGINDFFAKAGDYYYQIEQCGLSATQIYNRVRKLLNK